MLAIHEATGMNAYSLLLRMRNCTATLENNFATSHRLNKPLTYESAISLLGYISKKKIKPIVTQRLLSNIHRISYMVGKKGIYPSVPHMVKCTNKFWTFSTNGISVITKKEITNH